MADPRVALLKNVPLFARCTEKQLAFIATQVEDIDVPAARVLCREGESGGEFFIIVSGTAEVTRGAARVQDLGAGSFFGEIALLDHGPRTATVTATTAMRCLVLSQAQFQNVLAQDPFIATTILHAVGERIRGLLAPHSAA